MKIVIIGSGKHAHQVLDILKSCDYEFLGFVDEFDKNNCLGGFDIIEDIIKQHTDVKFFIGIGESKYRRESYSRISKNALYCNIIHPSSIISKNSYLGIGNLISPNVVINNNCKIGDFCILNTSAIIEHDCNVGSFANINPRATICGSCSIGNSTTIGAGSTIIENKKIGNNSVIGAGSIIVNNIEDNTLNYGVPSKKIKKINDDFIIY